MADIVDSATRSRMMSGIRGKDTKPERLLRSSLHALGFRFRLQAKDLPGRPDLTLARFRAAVFVHGCFWHRHSGCRHASTPATRRHFWQAKFDANVARDRSVRLQLLESGWRVATIWECALRSPSESEVVAHAFARWLPGEDAELELSEASLPRSFGTGLTAKNGF